MMGQHNPQKELFVLSVDLDRRVRSTNPLRKVKEKVDFSWVRDEVKDTYGCNGNVSVDPVIIVKLLFLLFWDNVRSERELMRIVAERLDYLWFLDMGLDDPIPDHSVLSKARARWGRDLFEQIFVRSVEQCMEQGLVGGKVLHVDGSLIAADAAKNSVVNGPEALIDALKQAYGAQEKKLEGHLGSPYYKARNRQFMNTTDPDAPVVSRNKPGAKGDPRPSYKNHRVVDDQQGVITAMETTPGDVEENRKLSELINQHEAHCGNAASTIVADSQYGTIENFRILQSAGYQTHMAILHERRRRDHRHLFARSAFHYDKATNTFTCPAGQRLYPRRHDPKRKATEYHTRKGTCAACPLKMKCTRSQNGRTIMRHDNQEWIDRGHAQARSPEAQKNRIRRTWIVEGSFGQATRHHFKRSRYRRLWRQQIQDYLIAAVQNIKKLIIAAPSGGKNAPSTALSPLKSMFSLRIGLLCSQQLRCPFADTQNSTC